MAGKKKKIEEMETKIFSYLIKKLYLKKSIHWHIKIKYFVSKQKTKKKILKIVKNMDYITSREITIRMTATYFISYHRKQKEVGPIFFKCKKELTASNSMSRENILQEHNRNKNNLRPQKTKSFCKQNAKENPTERERK